MVRHLAPCLLALVLTLPFAGAGFADSTPAPADSAASSDSRPGNRTHLAWTVCRISWNVAWEVPGAGSLAFGACLYAIHLDLEDYFSPNRP